MWARSLFRVFSLSHGDGVIYSILLESGQAALPPTYEHYQHKQGHSLLAAATAHIPHAAFLIEASRKSPHLQKHLHHRALPREGSSGYPFRRTAPTRRQGHWRRRWRRWRYEQPLLCFHFCLLGCLHCLLRLPFSQPNTSKSPFPNFQCNPASVDWISVFPISMQYF